MTAGTGHGTAGGQVVDGVGGHVGADGHPVAASEGTGAGGHVWAGGQVAATGVRHVRAVLTDRIVEDATVVIEGGRIVSVAERGAAPSGALDGRGAFCLPGLIDTHCDGLEKELAPRPGVKLPFDFAMASFEGRVRAAGITTMFHGIAFENNEHETRTIEQAERLYEAIETRQRIAEPPVDHRLLHRLDARDPAGLDALRKKLADHRAAEAPSTEPLALAPPPLVSFEDHTPGQGQYANPDVYRAYLESSQGLSRERAQAELDEFRRQRDARLSQRDYAIGWLSNQAEDGEVRLLGHDLANAAEVTEAVGWGVAVAEFPTSLEAAAAAQEAGLAIVLGAPNILRGGSHSGNVSAEELVGRGLCTALASDYLPSTLLAAAFRLAERGTATLPAALALVTSGPAAITALQDRGTLAEGRRVDLILATVDSGWPTVRTTLRAPSFFHFGSD